ncbi:hypothetical protein [Sphingomonas sp. IW22]|uniref:hypothetical protein n=1 Tax=Sphingomonas sp. IW22 TaxID=3242489 RepID=UPI0035217E50
MSKQLAVSYTMDAVAGDLLYGARVDTATSPDGNVIDLIPDWNSVKNVQLVSESAQNFYFDGFVHVDAAVGLNDTNGSTLVLNGTKRGNIITGAGSDVIDVRVVEDQDSIWVTTFRINTGGGDDVVSFKPLDIAGELAAGDATFVQAVNKPGLPLIATAEGRTTFTALGSGNDLFLGFNSDDHIAGQVDNGTIDSVFQNAPPSGVAYSIGGSTSCGHQSRLYRIDLETGATTVVGDVTIKTGLGKSGKNVDVESLSLNPIDGMLYGFISSPGNVTGLIKVDPLTAETTYIGGHVRQYKSETQDFAFGTDGKLYLASEGDLVSVEIATGAFTIIGNNTLNKKIGGLAFDPITGKLFGLADVGWKTYLVEIDKSNGNMVEATQIRNLSAFTKLEGASFDSEGTLWALDRLSGKLVTIDTATGLATKASKTLGVWHQTGDGFEGLAIDIAQKKMLVDLKAQGGDRIVTGEGADHVNYAAGDGVDVIADFDLANDTLHIEGYSANQIKIDVFNGNTFIRFTDNSTDGFVDNAMIELSGVINFDQSMIVYSLSTDFPIIV